MPAFQEAKDYVQVTGRSGCLIASVDSRTCAQVLQCLKKMNIIIDLRGTVVY